MSEQEAIQQAQAGNEAAFEQLYRQHRSKVYRQCRRIMGTHEDAEDMTQETFMHVQKKLHQFRGDSAFTTWLHRVTMTICLMAKRQPKSKPQILSLEAVAEARQAGGADHSPSHVGTDIAEHSHTPSHDLRMDLLSAINALPPGYRQITMMRLVEGMQIPETAAALGCTPGNVKSQLNKARAKLVRTLG